MTEKLIIIILISMGLILGCNYSDRVLKQEDPFGYDPFEPSPKSDDMFITTDQLPDAEYNFSYETCLKVAGGSGDYTFGILQGSLPAGIALSGNQGIFLGTLLDQEADIEFVFTIQATDNETGISATKNLSILINPEVKYNRVTPESFIQTDKKPSIYFPYWAPDFSKIKRLVYLGEVVAENVFFGDSYFEKDGFRYFIGEYKSASHYAPGIATIDSFFYSVYREKQEKI